MRENNLQPPPPSGDPNQPLPTGEGSNTGLSEHRNAPASTKSETTRSNLDDDDTSLAINPAPPQRTSHEPFEVKNLEYDASTLFRNTGQSYLLPPTPSRPSPQFDDPSDEPSPGAQNIPDDNEGEGDSIANLLAARMGSLRIAEDGQLRYYGPTSNLHINPNGSNSLSRSMIRQVATEGIGVLRRLGLDQEVPLDVEMHLAKLYFAWEDPAIHVVHEETFFMEKRKWALEGDKSSPYYSETLNNAM